MFGARTPGPLKCILSYTMKFTANRTAHLRTRCYRVIYLKCLSFLCIRGNGDYNILYHHNIYKNVTIH